MLEASTKVLWTLNDHKLHWESGLQAISSSSLQDSFDLSCVFFEEGSGIQLQGSNQLAKTKWRRLHLAQYGSSIGYLRASIILAYSLRSDDLVEIYEDRICHMGTNNDFATIASPLSLRTTLLLKGEGVLGTTLTSLH